MNQTKCSGTVLGGPCPSESTTSDCILHGPTHWTHEPVNSSAIRVVEFSMVSAHDFAGELKVTFVDGTEATYPDVDMTIYTDLVTAPSVGRFYNKFIRGKLDAN